VTGPVLLLTPSRGLGGGIERYVETLEWAFADQGIEHARVDLYDGRRPARASAYTRVVAQCRLHLRASDQPTRLVVAHRALLPAASLIARDRLVSGISMVCHGSDVWGVPLRPRWYIEKQLMRAAAVRVVAVSAFTSGALANISPATILPPGLSRPWFDELVQAGKLAGTPGPDIGIVTAFRLADWRGKGLPQLLEAVGMLGRPDIRVTICGSGDPPPELREMVGRHPNCALRPGLSDSALAAQLAEADLFVLATRTRLGRNASGEGFGLVLLEAQIAGTPVVAPAYGGSHDAYLDRTTGVAPTDESAEALARVLDGLVTDPRRLTQMGSNAAAWAREAFAPDRYAPLAVARLL
jgi:glycosyltransferase involved in cell wall biosynthesis